MKLRAILAFFVICCLLGVPLVSCKKGDKAPAKTEPVKTAPVENSLDEEDEEEGDEEEAEEADEGAAEQGTGLEENDAGAIRTGGETHEDPEVMYEQLPMNPDDLQQEEIEE